jgi:N-acyl-D-aspartate/D-glutamate deacylase
MALDVLIRNGTLIDGTGAAARRADVGIANGRIAAIGKVEGEAKSTIHADGLTVAPGFIDIHSHSDYTLLVDPRAVSALMQGVTTEVIGNCGYGCGPIGNPTLAAGNIYGFNNSIPLRWRTLGEYLDRLAEARPAINVLTLVPNGQLRLTALGLSDKPADVDGLKKMTRLLCEGLEQGAFGYSVGLEYAPEAGASEDELVTLCRECARHGALHAVHTRKRDAGAVEAIGEALRIGERSGVKLQISHLWPRSSNYDGTRGIALVEAARGRGQDVAFDMHTRLFGTTYLAAMLPSWAREGSAADIAARLADGAARARIKEFTSIISGGGDWERVVLLDNAIAPEWSRLSFAEIGRRTQKHPHDAALDILARGADDLSQAMVIIHYLNEERQRECFSHPLCVPGSDATTMAPDGPLAKSVFHGAYGWAAWYWRFMVRDRRALTAEDAIRRLTGQPAATLGLKDRGEIRLGARADVVVFDAGAFGERTTTFEPNQLAVGMRHVLVNGCVAVRDGALTGDRAGEVLRRAR